jgi:hypothetical protein
VSGVWTMIIRCAPILGIKQEGEETEILAFLLVLLGEKPVTVTCAISQMKCG